MVPQAIKLAIEQVASQLESKRLELVLEVPDSLPPVGAEADSVRQIAVMLIEHAIAVSPSESRVQVAAHAEDPTWVTLSVTDSGGGVPPEDLGRAFQPQLPAEGELATVRELAEAAGGRLWIDSEVGSGTTIAVQIPVREG